MSIPYVLSQCPLRALSPKNRLLRFSTCSSALIACRDTLTPLLLIRTRITRILSPSAVMIMGRRSTM
jgi:hypothetical protein